MITKKIFLKIVLIGFILSSCSTKKDILYVLDAKDKYDGASVNFELNKIQTNDILNVTISTLNPELSQPFNKTQPGQNAMQIQNLNLIGYLVSPDYKIDLPIIGEIDVYNKTTEQVKQAVKNKLIQGGHLTDPRVEVIILNSRFKILGEVGKPGVHTYSEATINILEAIAMAGDLKIEGVRNDIRIIRTENGVQSIGTIDLTKGDIINSPFFNLKQNDLIIVNQNGPRIKSAGFIGNLGTALSVGSILLSTILLLTRN